MITFLKPEEQHQHKNGGGWVANTANAAEEQLSNLRERTEHE